MICRSVTFAAAPQAAALGLLVRRHSDTLKRLEKFGGWLM
jgi:hypothetical protein